jgi:hypothetical protein
VTPLSPQVVELLPQLSAQPAAVADQMKALADQGDESAVLLAAWTLSQAGRWQEGIPYAKRAAELGAVMIAANYIGNLFSVPEQTNDALDFLAVAMDGGWSVDPLGWLPTVGQRGDTAAAARLIELATTGYPRSPDVELQTLLERLRQSRREIDDGVAAVESAKNEAISSMREREDAVAKEQERLAELGHKIDVLAHEAAADELARQYEHQAKRSERSAFWFTAAALLIGTLAVALAAYFTLHHIKDKPDIAEGLAKAGISIPFALLAAYLGRLGARFRQIGWRWRHVELQLRTAEPYIAELDAERRSSLIEALALRFFPGQPLDVGDGAAESPGARAAETELAEAAAALARAATATRPPA